MNEKQRPPTRREAVKKMALGTAGFIAPLMIPHVAQAVPIYSSYRYCSYSRPSYFSVVYTSLARYTSYFSYSSVYSSIRSNYSNAGSSGYSSSSKPLSEAEREGVFLREYIFISDQLRQGKSYQQIADMYNAARKVTTTTAVGVETYYLMLSKECKGSSK